MAKVLWVLVNCNTIKEAEAIGKAALRKRLTSCFDIFSRHSTHYFWPPKSGKIESAKGGMLVMETMQTHFKKLEGLVKKMHSDKLPFIGSVEIGNVSTDYINWIKGELEVSKFYSDKHD